MRTTWDEERIGSAYRARYARPVSAGLVDAVLERVRFEAARPAPRWGNPLMVAGIAAALVLVAVGVMRLVDLAPGPTAAPSSVSGIPVVAVERALELRSTIGDAEIAVRGWFQSPPGRSCPPKFDAVPPLDPVCVLEIQPLMARPESLVTVVRDGMEGHGPDGPRLDTVWRPLGSEWAIPLPDLGPSTPTEVVVLGHFADRRSAWCRPAQPCLDRFVVDLVAWANGRPVGPATLEWRDTGDPAPPAVDLDDLLARIDPGAERLTALAIANRRLPDLEPGLPAGLSDIDSDAMLWWVTALGGAEPGTVRTYLIVDPDTVFVSDDTSFGGPISVPPASSWDRPAEVDGLPVISVADAIARRDAGRLTGRVVAIGGWWWEAGIRHSCRAPTRPTGILERYCHQDEEILADVPQDLLLAIGEGFSLLSPDPPSLQPVFPTFHTVGPLATLPVGDPVSVVFIGHFGDPLTADCAPEARRSCADVFVVDRVAWVEGRAAAESIWPPADEWPITPQRTLDEVRRTVRTAVGDSVLVLTVAFIKARDVAMIDPTTDLDPEGLGYVWFVRAADTTSGSIGTFILLDGEPGIRWQRFPYPEPAVP